MRLESYNLIVADGDDVDVNVEVVYACDTAMLNDDDACIDSRRYYAITVSIG